MTATMSRKLAAVVMTMLIFACLGAVTTSAVEIGSMNALLIGAGMGLFEEFYVQSPRGNWLRAMHPLRVILIEILVVMVLYLIALHITHVVLGRLDDLPVVYRRLPYGIAFFTAFSIVGILMMRVAHFIGLRALLDLIIGTYHRPVEERKVLLFLDINGSTALAERLGALTMRALVRQFLSDLSQPIVTGSGPPAKLEPTQTAAAYPQTRELESRCRGAVEVRCARKRALAVVEPAICTLCQNCDAWRCDEGTRSFRQS